jgi:glycosyltransferase involved in cell wall biosynthesis
LRVLLTIHHALDANAGAPGATIQVAQALRALGHEAEVYSWDDPPARLGPRGREALFPLFVARRLRRAARAGVDVADCSTADAWLYLVGRRARRAIGRGPLIVTRTHGLERTYREARAAQAAADGEPIPLLERGYHDGWRLREAELTLRLADAALFLSSADRDRATRELGVSAERAHIVPNGVPDAFMGLPAPAASGSGEPLRLVQLGSWDPRKGVADVVAALSGVFARLAGVQAAFLGTTVAAETVRGAFPADVRERIEVRERFERAELPSLLRGRDVLLLPSLAEGFSLALLEGMACGLAPIATTVGAAPDVIADGVNGLLVPPANPAALAAAIEQVAGDRTQLQRMRAAAHADAQRYAWSRVAADTAALYERLAAGGS